LKKSDEKGGQLGGGGGVRKRGTGGNTYALGHPGERGKKGNGFVAREKKGELCREG